ncbi:hypothetical protein FRB95_003849 [Tulasnella sp. JGI-2019a]|nr:hypothetical protein FRB93_003714 [Tulasnella sp. JGI-2019a]KAG9030520.1 hypothetical protein FRB95_003849 [Tulasnella sp. JGI-2019a]
MRFSLTPALTVLLLLPLSLASSYFLVTKPAQQDQWTQGQPHAVNWIHGADGIDVIDMELGRTSTSGLLLAAREVPTSWGSLNLLFGNVPPGDDYFLVFLNVTHGLVYSISPMFSILPAAVSSANTSAQIAPDPSKPTVTVTGAPGPTMSFAATFGPQADGAAALWSGLADGRTTMILMTGIAISLVAGVSLVF